MQLPKALIFKNTLFFICAFSYRCWKFQFQFFYFAQQNKYVNRVFISQCILYNNIICSFYKTYILCQVSIYFTVYRQLFYSALERRQPAIQPDSILISGECSSRENLHASHISSMDKTLTVNGSDTCAALPSVHCPKSNPIFRDVTWNVEETR